MAESKNSKTTATGERKPTVISMRRYDDAVDWIEKLELDIDQLSNELRYLTSFIEWAGLLDRYEFFQANAREVQIPDLPYTSLHCIPFPGAEPESRDSTLDAQRPGSP